MRVGRFVGTLIMVLDFILAAETGARADDGDARVVGETLFREGRRLMETGEVAEGCRKLEESQRVDPAAGTLLALAACHEMEGKIATSWSEFAQSVLIARRDGRSDREQFARAHLAKLEPQLPRVIIDVPAVSRVPGLVLSRNGTDLTEVTWGLPIPCDPGEVVVTARAAGRMPWRYAKTIGPGETLKVVVPLLGQIEPEPAHSPGARPTTNERTAAGVAPRRTLALAIGGFGLAAIGVGAGFGVDAIDKAKDVEHGCPIVGGLEKCTSSAVATNDAAKTSATIANVGVGVGLLALAVAGYLFLTAKPSVMTTASAGGMGAVVEF